MGKKRKLQPAGEAVPDLPFTYVNSSLNLFGTQAFDLTQTSSVISEHYPLSSTEDANVPVTFNIKGSDQYFVALNEIQLYLKCEVLDRNGGAVVAATRTGGTDIAPVNSNITAILTNNVGETLWSKVELHINDTLVTQGNTDHHYKAYLDTILGFSKDYLETVAASKGFYKETDWNYSATRKDGHDKRKALSTGEFELLFNPMVDFFRQGRFLIPGQDIRLTLYRTPRELYMYQDTTTNGVLPYSCKIKTAKLIVPKYTILDSVLSPILAKFQTSPILYPFLRSEIKTFLIPANSATEVYNESAVSGLLPTRLCIGILKSAQYTGSINENTFSFKNQALKYINVYCNGHPVSNPIELNYASDLYMGGYCSLLNFVGDPENGLPVTYDEYLKLYCLYGFNLSQISGGGVGAPTYGNVKIEIKFRTAPAESLTVLVYGLYTSCVELYSDKAVKHKDYTII